MNSEHTVLPDIMTQTVDHSASLQWVGMESLSLPLAIPLANGEQAMVSATLNIYVSLDTQAKGIHMSRLYLQLNQVLANKEVNVANLDGVLGEVLTSHKGISNSARIEVTFDLPINKPSLKSGNFGYQSYPITVVRTISGETAITDLSFTIPYSSTCPCSASLARQLIADKIEKSFDEEVISKKALIALLNNEQEALATPHNQRSYAYIKLRLNDDYITPFDTMIVAFEDAIGTPVQAAVKRADEQAFAELNGNNLMFCEDAARRLKGALENMENAADYWFKVEHQESLHAHNAVVIDQKEASSLRLY